MASMYWLLLAYLVLLRTNINAADIDEEAATISNAMTFSYNGVQYSFITRPRSWSMARLDCEARDLSLASLTHDDIARFIAENMADLPEAEDLWIGARLNRSDNAWKWYSDDSVLPGNTKDGDTFPQESYPYWAERPEGFIQKKGDHCVAIHRHNHAQPLFVVLPCTLKRAFICEKSGPEETDTKLIVTDRLNETKYSIYVGNMTWYEGVAHCRSKKEVIATITSLDILQRLSKKMMRARPMIESVWLGGLFSDVHHNWEWITTGKRLEGVAGSPDWSPPWYQKKARRSGCLVLDRRLSEEPVFIAKKCNKRRSVVCKMSDNSQFDRSQEEHEGPGVYVVVEETASWHEAQSKCRRKSEKHGEGRLLTLNDATGNPEFVNNLTRSLVESDSGPSHVWLGGLYDVAKGRWYWSEDPTSDKRVYFDEATFKIGNTEFFQMEPEVEGNKEDSSCLNLDRENHNALMLYGLACNFSQAYVCYYPSSRS